MFVGCGKVARLASARRCALTLARMFARDLRFYLISRFSAGTAMTLMRAAIAWHVFALSHSAFHLGLIEIGRAHV